MEIKKIGLKTLFIVSIYGLSTMNAAYAVCCGGTQLACMSRGYTNCTATPSCNMFGCNCTVCEWTGTRCRDTGTESCSK